VRDGEYDIAGHSATFEEFNLMIEALESKGFLLFFEKYLQPLSDEVQEQVDQVGITKENYEDFIKDCARHSNLVFIKTMSAQIRAGLKELDKQSQK